MKKIMFLLAAVLVLMTVSCTKQKNCRCAVMGSQTVRIITISKGDCSKINYVTWYNDLDTAFTDHVVCTDFPFEADTAIVNL